MALVHFLVFFGFCVACWWVIHWFLKSYVSSKPWHRWIRYTVWAGCIGLLTFDSIYYQVAVVHGMCAADQKRVYPTPPASLVVGGPYVSESDLRSANLKGTYRWNCQKKSTNLQGTCLIDGVVAYDEKQVLPFGGEAPRYIMKDEKTSQIYRVKFTYTQEGQWLSKKIFGFGIIWINQPTKCEDGFWSPESPIILD